MFAYPLPSIPTHFQPILIENLSNPIGINPKSEFSLRCYPPNDINEQDPYTPLSCRVFGIVADASCSLLAINAQLTFSPEIINFRDIVNRLG